MNPAQLSVLNVHRKLTACQTFVVVHFTSSAASLLFSSYSVQARVLVRQEVLHLGVSERHILNFDGLYTKQLD